MLRLPRGNRRDEKDCSRTDLFASAPAGLLHCRGVWRMMTAVNAILPGEDPRRIVAALKTFRRETLALVYPVAGAARDLVSGALGWDGLRPLVDLVEEIAAEAFGEHALVDVPNCDDPTSGVVARDRFASVLQQVDPMTAVAMLQSLHDAKAPGSGAAMLVAAVAGWNRPQVLVGLTSPPNRVAAGRKRWAS